MTVSLHRHVRRELADVEPEGVEPAQGPGGEAVAARLVPGEARLVDDERRQAEPARLDARGHTCRARPDDQDVDSPVGACRAMAIARR